MENATFSYVVNKDGYDILKNGVVWMSQRGYIPYPGVDMEESVQNHLDIVVREQKEFEQGESDVEILKKMNSTLVFEIAMLKVEVMKLKAGAK